MARSQSLLRSGSVNIVSQVLFLVAMYLAGNETTPPTAGILKDLVILILSAFPCTIWMTFFYLQDRVEPEPSGYVAAAGLTGMAIASLFYIPIVYSAFGVNDWIYQSFTTLFLASIFITGATASFLFYLSLRFGFYPTNEFDEPADGMAYGAFIGTGFALVQSIAYLSRHPEYTLFSMTYTSSSNALVYASIGSLVGYYVAKSKFAQGNHRFNSLIGITSGMLLFGIYQALNEFIILTSIAGVLWLSFILTLVFSIAVLTVVYLKMRKLTSSTFQQTEHPQSAADQYVLILFAVLMVFGAYLKFGATQDLHFAQDKYGISFEYPRNLDPSTSAALSMMTSGSRWGNDLVFSGEDRSSDGFSFLVEARSGSPDSAQFSLVDYTGQVQPASVRTEDIEIVGRRATRLKYSLQEPGTLRTDGFPALVWIYTDIIPTPRYTYFLTFRTKSNAFEKTTLAHQRILSSLHISQ